MATQEEPILNLDIAVIGASSSGLYAAQKLAAAGRRVGVFEQQKALNPARRTLIITPQLLKVLEYDPAGSILHTTRVMRVATRNALTDVTLREPDLIIERNLFAQHLVHRARAAGAALHLDHRLQGITPHVGGAELHFKAGGAQKTVLSRAVIGADGVTSSVARLAEIPLPPRVPILQAEVALPPGWDPQVTQVWFDVEDTRYFYWLIPESANHGVVGLVGDGRQDTRSLLEAFLEKLGLQPIAYQGAQVAMHHPRLQPWRRVGAARVLLIGDAAGQVKVTTVGGTVSGLWGADAAVEALIRGKPYAGALRALKRELDLHWLIRLLLERLDNKGYDRLVAALNPAVQRFLARHNRDAMAGAFWKLPFIQPGFLLLGLRMVLPRLPQTPRKQTTPVTELD